VRGLLSIVVVAAALTFVGASRAAVGQSSYQPATLTIVTVPKLAGVHLAFDGRTYVTGRQGKVRIETTRGQHWLQILDTRLNTPGVRSTFSRWEDNRYTSGRTITIRGNTVVDAGFQQSVRVSFAFADLAGRSVVGRVSRMTLSNTLGSRVSFAPSWPRWLRATGLARSFRGLEPTFVQYSVERALVNGSNVVNQSQQRFYPAKTRRFTAQLLLYSARVRVRDFLFGTSIGNQLSLVYPSGTSVGYRLRGGNLLLSSLPRGTYTLDVHAGGYVPSVSLALSKNQSLDVKVVSYLDMALLLVLVLLSVTVLILFPRPFLRLRLRALGSGRRPTPDDLEPLTPLSRARKKLIARYMPKPDTDRRRPAGSSASRAVPRLPLPTGRAMVVPTSGESVERPLGKLQSRSFETAVESLRRRRQRLSDVLRPPLPLRPAARGRVPDEAALTGERIDLINVYMREQTASTQEMKAPAARQPQQPTAVPNAAAAARGDALRTTAAPESPAPPAPPRLAPVINLSPAPAVEEKPAPGVEEAVAPAVEEKPAHGVEEAVAPAVEEKPAPGVEEAVAPAVEEKPAPGVEEAVAPAVEEKPAPGVEEAVAPAVEEKPAPAVEEAAASAIEEKPKPTSPRKRTAPARRKHASRVVEEKLAPSAEGDAAPAIEEQPAPPRKRTAPARRKRTAPVVGEKPAAAVEGDAAPSRKRAAPAGRKRLAATGEESARPATRKSAAPAKQKRAAAAKAKTTAQPVRKRAAAKGKSTTAANRKSPTAARQKSEAPVKPKSKPRTAKKAATPAATQRRTRRTSVPPAPREEAAGDHDAGATNGGASRDEFARLPPDLVDAVEALRENLQKRTSTANQGLRESSGTVPR
jgi:hypothetical protein